MPAAALRTPAPVVTPQPPAPAPAPRARAAAPVVRQPASWPPAVRLSRAGAAAPAVATKRLIGTQTALRVSSPNDPAEHEAAATASKIVRMELPESSTAYVRGASGAAHRQLQREQARPIRTASSDSAITRRAARRGLAWRLGDGAIQRQAQGPASAPPSIASAIQASMSDGAPLPMDMRRFMEPRFRADFGDVRIHTDDRAAALNRQLNARAFTVGSHIFFGRGAFQPETPAGQELIAHELTHTVQQGAAVQRSADVSVTQQSPTQVQRLGLSDILDGLAELAANVPGFTLLTVIIGRNPINMRVVERNFTNLLRGFMGLIPGGEILFQVLNRYGIVERLGAWVEQQVNAIGLSYDYIRGRFTEFTDSLSWRDIFSPGDVWRRAQNIFSEPITRIRNFISRLIDQAITWLKETFMQPLSDFCRQIPGYTLVTVLLGRDPFTNAPVERSALNVVRAFAEFIPGGTEKVNQLVESRALQRAYEWFIQETQARNLTWARISGTFAQAWNSLRLEDVLHPIDTLQRIVGMFRPLMTDLVGFAGAALMKLLELIFEAVMGAGGARILAILKRARDTFLTIIRNPVGFLGNLLRAVGQGVRQFMTNILRHLQQGVIAWLTGPVARAGIQMPERWDLRGIIWFVLQILGLTWDRIRQKLVRLMGERAMAMLESGFQFIQEIREKGLVQALRDRVTEFFGQLRDAALGSIRSFIQQRLVMAGITQLLSLLNPVGAVIQAIIKTYTTIQFFIQRINQILDLVESIVNSIAAIASGSIGAAANFIEQTMARTIPVILDFLARFIGLGDVGGQVQRTIQSLQARVDAMLDRAVDWIRSMAQRLATAVVQAGVPNDPNERLRLGLRAATDAVNRFAGRRVGAAVLNPLLTIIKTRYGFRTLEVAAQGNRWAVEGEVNPRSRNVTDALIESVRERPLADPRDVTDFDPAHFSDAQIRQLYDEARRLGLDLATIRDLLFIAGRREKPITAERLIAQMNHWVRVRPRGYPYKFDSLPAFRRFSSELIAGIAVTGLPTNDVRIQGSTVRSPQADDIDTAICLADDEFDQLLFRLFAETARPLTGEVIERYNIRTGTSTITNVTGSPFLRRESLRAQAEVIRRSPGAYNTVASTFSEAMLRGLLRQSQVPSLSNVANQLQAEYGKVAVSVVRRGGRFDLRPFLRVR